MTETLKLDLQFGGGAELLFDKIKKRTIELPPLQTYLPKCNKTLWTIEELLIWLKQNLLREREELFLQNGTVRPGILVLINDTDWELHVLVLGCIFKLSGAEVLPAEVLKDLLQPVRYLGEGCGYESCPRYSKADLNVHIIPHTHGELGLTSFFDRHFSGEHPGLDRKLLMNMKTILDATVTQLWNNPARRFTLSDLPYFFHWWSLRDGTVRRMVYQLLRQNRLTLVGGGWGMPDEATTNYQAVIDSHTFALRKLNSTFLECGGPIVAWQSDCAGHSREFASLYAQMGYDGFFLSPISHDDELTRMGQKAFEFVWRGSDDLGRESDIYTHKLFDGFSCPPGFCFGSTYTDPLIVSSSNLFKNIDDRAQQFIDDIRNRQAPNYRTNHVMVVMGGRFAYYDAEMWFRNIERLIMRVNEIASEKRLGVFAFYSTPACYLKAVHDAKPSLPIKQDDFFPHQENPNTYATGMYTSMPALKYMLTEGNVYLQMTKQIQVLSKLKWGVNDIRFEELHWIMGVMQDHTVVTGELTTEAYSYYTQRMYVAVQKATLIMKDGINKLRGCDRTQVYYRCSFNESSCPPVNRFGAHIVVYNPLAWPVTIPVRLPVLRGSQMVIYNPKGEEVRSSLMPIPELVLQIPERDTVAGDDVVFLAEDVPALGFRSYYIARFYLRRLKRSILKKQSRINEPTPPAPAQPKSPSDKLALDDTAEESDYDDLKANDRDATIMDAKPSKNMMESSKLSANAKPVLKWDPELIPGFDTRGPKPGPPVGPQPDSAKAEDTRRLGPASLSLDLGEISDLDFSGKPAESGDSKTLEEGLRTLQQPLSDYSDYGDPKLTGAKLGFKPGDLSRTNPREPSDYYYDEEDTGALSGTSRTSTVGAPTTAKPNVATEDEITATESPWRAMMPPMGSMSLPVKKQYLEFVVSQMVEQPISNVTEEEPKNPNENNLPEEVQAKLKELDLIKEKYKTEQIITRKMLYNYQESLDDFIENQYVKIFVNRTTGRVNTMVLASGGSINLDIEFLYYESDDPVALGKHLIPPGPFVFRPLDPKPQSVGSKIVTKIYKTPVVQEVHMLFSSYAGLALRLYNHRSVVEVDWLVGPLESDVIGKEVFLRYSTDLQNGGVFYTDSNGRQTIKRIRGRRPMYTIRKPDPVAGNFYPVTSKIYIEDPNRKLRFAVFNDRSQGGSSLNEGQIDLMLHRKLLTLDSIAVAYLNETEYGQPIRVRGKHYLYLTPSDENQYKVFEKKLAKEISLEPQVFAAHTLVDQGVWQGWTNEFSGVSSKLPFGVHLLTLQEWSDNTLLIRVENYLEKSDVTEEHWLRKVYLKYLFSNLIITSVKELTLGANQLYRDWTPLEWRRDTEFVKSFNEQYGKTGEFDFKEDERLKPIGQADLVEGITLEPQQIRTFVAMFSDRE